jgi:polysaccharide biosynthesis protein PslH
MTLQSRKILLISPVSSHPTISGSGVRPIYLAKQLQLLGFTPHFAYTDILGGDLRKMRTFWGEKQFHYFAHRRGIVKWELRRIWRRFGLGNSRLSQMLQRRENKPANPARIRPAVDDYYDDRMTPWLRKLQSVHGFDAVIAHYVIMSKALEAFPKNVRKILDTEDVYAVGREATAATGERLWIDITPSEELKALRRADFAWAIQGHDEKELRRHLGDRVVMVGHFIDPISEAVEASLSSKNILFVGGKLWANAEGLRWFGKEVYPLMASWLPPKNVVVAGKVKNAVGGELPFEFLGPVPHLEGVYRNSRLAICPILSGTGLKSKNVEAYAFSKPVVTTSFGRLGLEDADGRAHIVADDPKAFSGAIQSLMTDDNLCRKMMHSALGYAIEWNERLRGPMQRCLQIGPVESTT